MTASSRFIVGALSVLLIAALLAGAYFFQRSKNLAQFSPQGALILSLAVKGSPEVNLYRYDIETGTLTRLGQDGNSNFDARVALDGNRIAHVAYGPRALASQVVIYDTASGERRSVTRGEAFRHSPDWSPVGSGLAFSEEVKGGSDIYAADIPNTPLRIGAGAYPIWSLDGKSIFALSSSGLVRYDLTSGAGPTKVWGAKGAGMKLSASPDHSLVAWLIPAKEQVLLFKANPVNPRELLFNKALAVRAYDAVFSKDNAYVALRVPAGEGDLLRFEVAIRKLDTGEQRSVLDLSPYEMKTLYLSSWK